MGAGCAGTGLQSWLASSESATLLGIALGQPQSCAAQDSCGPHGLRVRTVAHTPHSAMVCWQSMPGRTHCASCWTPSAGRWGCGGRRHTADGWQCRHGNAPPAATCPAGGPSPGGLEPAGSRTAWRRPAARARPRGGPLATTARRHTCRCALTHAGAKHEPAPDHTWSRAAYPALAGCAAPSAAWTKHDVAHCTGVLGSSCS